MTKALPKISNPKLPHNVALFQDHLSLGLECFELDWFDFRPHTCENKEYGIGLLFSQLDNTHGNALSAENSLIVSNKGLHFPDEKLMPFTNEQPPTKMAFLVLSAMVMQEPLYFECPCCDN